MKKNKIILIITVVFIFLLVGTTTTIKVINNHNEKLYLVVKKRIEEAAKKCRNEDICINEKITLKELYENNYLEKESDPLTKAYYNEESYVIKEEDIYKFVIIK